MINMIFVQAPAEANSSFLSAGRFDLCLSSGKAQKSKKSCQSCQKSIEFKNTILK